MKIKKLFILVILTIILLSLSGCYDAHGIEEFSYATAIGLDISEDKLLSLTLQISIPSTDSESGSSQSSKTDTITVKCNSINSGINLINNYISKEVNLSHCKVIVISEEFAAQGLSECVDTLANIVEIRPDCNVIITKCSAKKFIENASPSIETLTARYYEVALKSSEYTGFTPATKSVDFIGDMKNNFIQSHAILGNLTMENENTKLYSNLDNNYTAGETPIEGSSNIEFFGTAVFRDDKLVGELNGIESICYLLVSDNFKNCTLSIPDPFNVDSSVDLRINKKRNSKISVDFVNNSPFISVEVFLEGYGISLDENTDYSSVEDINILNNYAEQYLKLQLENYLYKTSKEFNSDISGFGKYALSKYLTWDEWISSNWLENYKNSFFNVKVNVNIQSGGQFNKSP